MKTAISIPDDLFHDAERFKKRARLSRSELYRRALVQFLQHEDEAQIAAALNDVYGEGAGDGRLDPVLQRMQHASVPRDEW